MSSRFSYAREQSEEEYEQFFIGVSQADRQVAPYCSSAWCAVSSLYGRGGADAGLLTLIFAVLWAASTVGVQHFYAAVGGFLLVHFVMMAHLILREMRSDKQNGDFPQGR